MENTLVINLFGGPGSGKSTMAAGVFHQLKIAGLDCELVTEFAKFATWERNWTALENQLYISAKQIHREYVVLGKVDVLITDSPILLGLMYYKEENEKIHEAYKRLIVETFKSRNNFNVFVHRKKQYNKNGRNQSEDEAIEIDRNILKLLDEHNIDYYELSGNELGTEELSKHIEKLITVDK